jgi:hypothetical protein
MDIEAMEVAEEKEKWTDSQKQSTDQNLTGRKSWSFLASCMTPASTASKIDQRLFYVLHSQSVSQ